MENDELEYWIGYFDGVLKGLSRGPLVINDIDEVRDVRGFLEELRQKREEPKPID